MSNLDVFSTYKSVEVVIATGTTDRVINLTTNADSSATMLTHAARVIIKTDKVITVKFNKTDNDGMTLAIGTHDFDQLMVKIIYVSNSAGSDAAVKVIAFGREKVTL